MSKLYDTFSNMGQVRDLNLPIRAKLRLCCADAEVNSIILEFTSGCKEPVICFILFFRED